MPILTNNANSENFFVVVVAARFFHSRSKTRLMQMVFSQRGGLLCEGM